MATSKLARAKARIKKIAQEGAEAVAVVRTTAEATVVGGALGYYEAKKESEGEKAEVGGLPVSLLVGLGGVGLSFVPGARSAKADLQAVGMAGMTVYGHKYGKQMFLDKDKDKSAAGARRRRRQVGPGGVRNGVGNATRSRAAV